MQILGIQTIGTPPSNPPSSCPRTQVKRVPFCSCCKWTFILFFMTKKLIPVVVGPKKRTVLHWSLIPYIKNSQALTPYTLPNALQFLLAYLFQSQCTSSIIGVICWQFAWTHLYKGSLGCVSCIFVTLHQTPLLSIPPTRVPINLAEPRLLKHTILL